MRSRDQIEIIEAAYALDLPRGRWQYKLTDLVARGWGGTAASFIYDASRPLELELESLMVWKAGERTIVDLSVSVPQSTPAVGRALFAALPHLVDLVDLLGPGFGDLGDYKRLLRAVPDLDPASFATTLRSLAPSRTGLFFALPSRPIGPRTRSEWEQIAVHLGLAHRLRQALANADNRGDTAARHALREAARDVIRGRGSLGLGESE